MKVSLHIIALGLLLMAFVLPLFSQSQTQLQTNSQTQSQKSSSETGRFYVELTGSVSAILEGESNLIKSPGGDWSISMAAQEKEGTAPRTVLIVLPGKIKTGTYEVRPYERAFNEKGRVESVGATVSSNEIIGLNASGSLQLLEAGPKYSGAFEFSVESYDKKQNVKARGRFDKLVEKKKEKEK